MKNLQRIKLVTKRFMEDERGEFGIKGIAMTVAAIVVIGLVIGVVQGNLGAWIAELWTMFIDQIEDLMS